MENFSTFNAKDCMVLWNAEIQRPVVRLSLLDTDTPLGFALDLEELRQLQKQIDLFFRGIAMHPELINSPKSQQ